MKISSVRTSGTGTGPGAVQSAGPAGPSQRAVAAAPIADTASIAGIPESEFTPRVRGAIMALLEEVEKLRRDLDQSRARIQHLEKLADEDALAPVANRRAFVRDLSRMLSYAQRYHTAVSVLYFDVNDMKNVNDSHGHDAGDAMITHIASMLANNIRESDVVGRLGGDEFGVILVNTSEEDARTKGDILVRMISGTPLPWKGKAISVGISFSLYSLTGSRDAAAMLEEADHAMYAHKSQDARKAV